MMRDDGLRRAAAAAVQTALNLTYREGSWLWEDIFTGLALTQVRARVGAVRGEGLVRGALRRRRPRSCRTAIDGFCSRAQVVQPPARGHLAAVHVGDEMSFMESFSHGRGPGLVLSPSALMWHERAKRPERFRQAQEWAVQNGHGCQPHRLHLSCRARYVACSGARWRRCVVESRSFTEANCSTGIVFFDKSEERKAAALVAARHVARADAQRKGLAAAAQAATSAAASRMMAQKPGAVPVPV
eukprot:4226212-Prymnesium_polylepis.1